MNFDIRKTIINNLKGFSYNELESSINQMLNKEEKVLPGLGVLFELYYNSLNNSEKTKFLKTLEDLLV